MGFYERLEEQMKLKGETCYSIWKNTGVNQSNFLKWKKGENLPSVKSLEKISNYLNVSPNYLMFGNEDKPYCYFKVEDDSLITFALKGDVLVYEEKDIAEDGQFVIISTPEQTCCRKYSNGVCYPINPTYPMISQFKIIGIVTELRRNIK